MNNEEIALAINNLKNKYDIIDKRTTKCEQIHEELYNIARSVDKLAFNMDNMVATQKEQNKRIDKLEEEPLENLKYYKKQIISIILSTIIGGVIGAIMCLIIK